MPRAESYPAALTLRYDSIDTPAGPVSFATDGERVFSIHLGARRRDPLRPAPLDREASRQLREYFAGRRRVFDLPTAPSARTFTGRVLEAVHGIPFGAALSYGEVAAAVGSPGAARAVGQAVGSNPLPLVIPCHRVLAAHGRLGGFGGGLAWKRFLLDLEGISYAP
jgi:methylated-DNA-[protein]-cysteine S-methyltransferase